MQGRRSYTPFSASFGALYQLPANIVALGRPASTPSARRTRPSCSEGAARSDDDVRDGNPNLRKEAATSAEIGLKRTQGSFRFDTSAYYTHFDGFIFKQLTASSATIPSSRAAPGLSSIRCFSVSATRTSTASSSQASRTSARVFGGVWGIDAQYDFVRARFTDALGGNVPRIPPHRAGAGVFFRDQNWFARTGFLHAFDQRDIGENETLTKGYTLLNADLSYTWKTGVGTSTANADDRRPARRHLLDDDVRKSRLLPEERRAAAWPHRAALRHREAELRSVKRMLRCSIRRG